MRFPGPFAEEVLTMKKRFVSFIALILITSLLALCAGCSKPAETADGSPESAPAATDAAPPNEDTAPPVEDTAPDTGRNAALDAAFAAGEPLRLVPVELPAASPGEDWIAIGLSPDGQTVLWRKTDKETRLSSLCLTRGDKVIPVVFNKDRGVGDPNNKDTLFSNDLFWLTPGEEGLSWSADGRLAALSDVYAATQRIQSPDVALIDTETGDLYLADSYACRGIDGRVEDMDSPNLGVVVASRIDRSGKYCYYLRLLFNAGSIAFCRVPVEGGKPEILAEIPRDENQPYGVSALSTLTEDADGSWVLSGVNGNESTLNPIALRLSLIRFSPSGDTWTASVTPTLLQSSHWKYGTFFLSPVSGYGIALLQNPYAGLSLAQTSTAETADALKQSLSLSHLTSNVSLLRFRPGETVPYDYWWMRMTGENQDVPEMAHGEPFLWSVKLKSGIISEDEQAESAGWIPQLDENYLPEGYDGNAHSRGEGWSTMQRVCLSPDGYYALVYYTHFETNFFCLISLEDMQVRPVDAPEEIRESTLIGLLSADYRPRMSWNADGTLLILNTDTDRTEAFRLEFGPEAN